MFLYLTCGETHYLDALRGILTERVGVWCRTRCIDPAALVWDPTQLPIELRYIPKCGPYCNMSVDNSGVFVPSMVVQSKTDV